jgi:DNA invertase Pin-like site-specific DNA recombinase
MKNKSKNRTPEETQVLVAFITEKKLEGLKAKQIQELLEWTSGQYEAFVTKNNLGNTKRVLTNEEIETVISMRANGSTMDDISSLLGITKSTLEKKLQELKITNNNKKKELSEEQLLEVKELIKSKVTQKEIAEKFDLGLVTLQKRLKENNVETKLYKVKHDYFSIVDTEEKAYFLGFMYADGYNGEFHNQIKLKLHRKDKAILESFLKALTYGETLPPLSEDFSGNSDTLSVQLTSKQLCDDLAALGCIQAKAHKTTFPTFLNSELMRHFVRGYFDGDGSIYSRIRKSGQEYITVNFTGCFDFINELNTYLTKELSISSNSVVNIGESTTSQVAYSSYSDIQALKNYLYENCNPELYLKRKFNKFPTKEFSDRIQLEQRVIKSKKVSEAQLGKPKESLQKAITISDLELLTQTNYKSVIEASEVLGINKDTLKAAIYKDRLVNKRYLVKYQEQDVTLQLQTNL